MTTRLIYSAIAFSLLACVSHASDGPGATWEAGGELAIASDVSLIQGTARAETSRTPWLYSISAAINNITIDYEPVPFDFRGYANTRRELNSALQFEGRRPMTERSEVLLGAGGSFGFTNYRSVWLDEYFYQQFFDFPQLPGADVYEKAHPRGINGLIGARWEYLPASGFAQLTVSQLRDHVSPGYEVDFDGLHRGPDVLGTTAFNLDFENVLTPRARSMVRLRAAKTSFRDWRWGAEGWINFAAGDAWIVRLNAGYTEEAPKFRAIYAGVSIERELSDSLSIIATGRLYDDTGEIENSLLFTSSAPGMQSQQARLGLRWHSESWSARITAGVLRSNYDETNPDTDFFQNLYRDRTWLIGQFAVQRSF